MIARVVPFFAVIVALLTAGAWLGTMHAAQPPPPFQPMQPPPPPEPPPPPAPRGSDCGSCDCSDCASCAEGCDIGDCNCDIGDCDLSGCTTLTVSAASTTRSLSLFALLLPLALLDAWRRRSHA